MWLINFLFAFILAFPLYSQRGVVQINTDLDSFIRLKSVSLLSDAGFDRWNLNLGSNNLQVIKLGVDAQQSLNSFPGIVWLAKEFGINETFGFDKELALNLINIGSANEVYWDNFLIGKKGSIGNPAIEDGEQVVQVLKVPYDLAMKGHHRLLIKVYNPPGISNQLMSSIEVGFNMFFMGRQIERNYMKIFFMSILFASAVYYLVLFFGFNKNVAYLFFSIYCLASSFKVYFLPYWLFDSSYATIDYSNPLLSVTMYIISHFALLVFLVIKFSLHKSHKIISIVLILSPFIFPLIREWWHYNLLIALTLGIPLYALIKKKPGSIYISVGVLGLIVISHPSGIGNLWHGYPLGILFLVIFVSILSATEIAAQYRKHREAVLRTVRLENELLKRNIQPHFILNTLASLEGIVEKNPKRASKFIHALAEEFQMFSKVSGEKLILLSDEMKICNAHLQIMEYRKGAKYKFNVQGLDGTERVPPGIFHTLVENGTTHGYVKKKEGVFNLAKEVGDGFTRYVFFNDSENPEVKEEIKKGTGIKYIEARLEESFLGLWKLKFGPVDDGWEVIIDIYERSKK